VDGMKEKRGFEYKALNIAAFCSHYQAMNRLLDTPIVALTCIHQFAHLHTSKLFLMHITSCSLSSLSTQALLLASNDIQFVG
jgi:hypothetical protein